MTSETTLSAVDWDPTSLPSQELQPELARLRDTCPVPFADIPGLYSFWSLMRYEDVTKAARNTEDFKNSTPRLKRRRVPLESDAPEHMKIRRLLQPFFLPKSLEKFAALATRFADELLEPMLRTGGGDAIAHLARPLPPQVLLSFLDQPRSDWQRIKEWSEQSYLQTSAHLQDREKFARADAALWSYSDQVIQDRIEQPRDADVDVVTAMLRAPIDGSLLDPDLVVGFVRLMLAAGHDSTTSSLAICLHYLARHPQAQARLRSQPALLPAAIEEMLRHQSPVLMMPRTAARDVASHGRAIGRGQRVMLNWASANRDPRAFENADECVLDRHPNRHVVFGHGVHTCLGAPLARQELKAGLGQLLARTRHFELDGEVRFHVWHRLAPITLPIRLETQ